MEANRLLLASQSSTVETTPAKNQLGTFNGVYIPCLLTILGIVLFMRMSWAVGQAGWTTVLAMFAVGESASMLTVLSMSALVSNGNIRGGGSYFLISRCLGPEMGGAIGLLFWAAYAVGACFYVVGFAEEVAPFVFDLQGGYRVKKRWCIVLIASIALLAILGISIRGAEAFARVNGAIFAVQFGSIFCALLSMWLRTDAPVSFDKGGGTFRGPSLKRLRDNAFSDYSVDSKCGDRACTTHLVFGILYNAMTGIMEGANLSGDLAEPGKSISKGTISAVLSALVLYVVLILTFASSFDRETLRNNPNVMQDSTLPSSSIVVLGIIVASFSAALNSLFGAARVLQALGKDDLPPGWGVNFFAKGTAFGDEPRRAVIFTWMVAQVATFVGDLDVLSPIIAAFFLLSYATVNLTTLLLDLSGTPNFRPRFRYYSRVQSFCGFLLCTAICFYLNVWYAIISCSFLLALSVWIAYTSPDKSWGDVSKSIMYHQIRKYLLRLDTGDEHVKHWRPSLLLLLAQSERNDSLIRFCNWLKKGGLFVIGNALQGSVSEAPECIAELRGQWLQLARNLKVKALPEVTLLPSVKDGFLQLVLLSGVGGMKPNTIVLPMPTTFGLVEDKDMGGIGPEKHNAQSGSAFHSEADFLDFVRNVLALKKNLVVACNFAVPHFENGLPSYQNGDPSLLVKKTIDVWIVGSSLDLNGSLSLQLQLAHILYTTQGGSRLRILNLVEQTTDIDLQTSGLVSLSKACRLGGKVLLHCIACDAQTMGSPALTNGVIHANSVAKTDYIFLALPDGKAMVSDIASLTKNLPPTLLVASGSRTNIIPQDL